MWISLSAAMLFLGGGGAHPAFPVQEEPAEPQSSAPADLHAAYIALEDEYDEAYDAYRQAYASAAEAYQKARETDPKAPFDGPEPVEPGFFQRFDRLAQAGASEAQLWCLNYYSPNLPAEAHPRDFAKRVMSLLNAKGADLSEVPQAIVMNERWGAKLSPEVSGSLLSLIEVVAEDPESRAMAAYFLANRAGEGIEDEVAAKQMRIEASRSVAARYPNTKGGGRAGGYVFSNEKLQIGMMAPDIVGKDVDGNPMKLSDFRGKVTVIDFWGFW